jgi:hypothetical protein
MSHPLDSADDAHDFSLSPGDTVGYFLSVRMIAEGASYPDGFGDTDYPGFCNFLFLTVGQDISLPTATDACDANPTVTGDAPAVYPLGTTTVTFTATDASGNQATATTTVTVEDTTPPALTNVPAPVTIEQEELGGTSFPMASFGSPTATDICDVAPVTTHDAPAVYPLGTTTVTFTATDASGNSSTATSTVTVVDTSAPTLSMPADVTAEQESADGTAVDIGAATATDICDAAVDITNDAPAVFPLGETSVTWTATDDTGNQTSAAQTVTVVDTTPPTISGSTEIVAEQVDLAGTAVDVMSHIIEVTDICDADPLAAADDLGPYPLGETTVTITATDDSGNSSEHIMTVRIVDTTAPTLVVPVDASAEQTSADGTAVDIGAATATDICDADVAIANDAPAVFPLGATTVTWTATDDTGSQTTATQTVTVVDTTPPTLSAPADIEVGQTELGGSPATHPDIAAFLSGATATDICDASPAITHDAPAMFPIGTTVVTFTATDASGNWVSQTASVTVVAMIDWIEETLEDSLQDAMDEIRGDPGIPDGAADEVQDALDDVVGNNDGQANNGAVDKLADDNLVAAMVKMRQAVEELQDAAAQGYETGELQRLIAEAARLAVYLAIEEAALALGDEAPSVLAARARLAEGDTLLEAGDYLGAIDKYKRAAQQLE